MKPATLSARLGLGFAAMTGALVLGLAALAYFSLSHQLTARALDKLDGKLRQIDHLLSENNVTLSQLKSDPHSVQDVLIGHEELHLTLLDASEPGTPLTGSDTLLSPPISPRQAGNNQVRYWHWENAQGQRILTGSQQVRLPDGSSLWVQLSYARDNDTQLLAEYLRAMLLALPLLVIGISAGAWWLAQRGLAPLRQFRAVTARVSTQYLSHRIPAERLPRELAEVADSINHMLERLDEGVGQLAQFSDDLAHELRTPISNLLGKAQVTLTRERSQPEYREVLESCVEELERLGRIVTDMLFLAQAEAQTAPPQATEVKLQHEAQRVMALLQVLADERGVSLQLLGAAEVTGNQLMIQRALSNLLHNAINHCAEGSQITLTVESAPNEKRISVTNTGPGIQADQLPHLFDRFYRVDYGRARSAGGTGLGLAIVRSIMHLHHGEVDVSSQPHGPTTFTLRFPNPQRPTETP
ncbi:heavy metal sensor histidine kinase [Halopseudomonas maritima]|uniref:heavy metal sensor histidine kinase n=1 Tax=Halopseudomonas maritima TaxID=2918528 RepID=UPI001EEB1CD3|nr:heavy metal sensor histidine kinase [Halopseudomonas maritima]UJJ32957.1 heavy metal sensor histidine kinase [Halopseudomonas maritima]